jgi:hypothetical protein
MTTLLGCQVFEPRYRGVYVAEWRNTRVAKSTVLDRTGTATMQAAIEVAGALPGTVSRGNWVARGRHGHIIALGGIREGNQVGP